MIKKKMLVLGVSSLLFNSLNYSMNKLKKTSFKFSETEINKLIEVSNNFFPFLNTTPLETAHDMRRLLNHYLNRNNITSRWGNQFDTAPMENGKKIEELADLADKEVKKSARDPKFPLVEIKNEKISTIEEQKENLKQLKQLFSSKDSYYKSLSQNGPITAQQILDDCYSKLKIPRLQLFITLLKELQPQLLNDDRNKLNDYKSQLTQLSLQTDNPINEKQKTVANNLISNINTLVEEERTDITQSLLKRLNQALDSKKNKNKK